MPEERIAITGIGVVSPLGVGAPAFWQSLSAGQSGIAELRGFDPGPRWAAQVPEFPARDFVPAALLRRMDRLSRMIVTASAMAFADGGLAPTSEAAGEDQAVVVGSELGNVSESAQFLERVFLKGPALASPMLFPNLVLNAPASQVAMALGWRGPNLTVSEAEVSGETAVAAAADLLRRGRAKAVIAAAGDELSAVVHTALRRFRYLSPRRRGREWSSPFDRGANGPVAGEGAAALLLEGERSAERRGARVYAILEDIRHFGLAARSPHLWPAPGAPLDLDASRPDVIFSGADSSPERDLLEMSLLSGATPETPIFSPKGATGEFGSIGLTNVVVAALCLSSGTLPPLASLEEPRGGYPFTYPRQALHGEFRHALVLGTARGGTAVTLRLGRAG